MNYVLCGLTTSVAANSFPCLMHNFPLLLLLSALLSVFDSCFSPQSKDVFTNNQCPSFLWPRRNIQFKGTCSRWTTGGNTGGLRHSQEWSFHSQHKTPTLLTSRHADGKVLKGTKKPVALRELNSLLVHGRVHVSKTAG